MQHLAASAIDVAGPIRFNTVLPPPQQRPAYVGARDLPPQMVQAMSIFSADVAVSAFPKPAAESVKADFDEMAMDLRRPYSAQPGTRP